LDFEKNGEAVLNYLLIDDDIKVYNLLKIYLNPGEQLFYLENLDEALKYIQEKEIKLVLLDINLEGANGLEFFSQNKDFFQDQEVQVFFLSQIQDIKSKLEAFQFGAQDYIVKPFEPLEIMARIRSRMSSHAQGQFVKKGDILFDLYSNNLSLMVDGKKLPIELSATEFKLLYFLAKREGQVFSRQQLLDQVWGANLDVIDRTVDQHISKLRKKVKSKDYSIKTNFNLGYSFARVSADP
jgi:DNA-binding response OmpR family regulator